MNSKFGQLNYHDVIKGFITALAGATIVGLKTSLDKGTLPSTKHELLAIASGALVAGLSYLLTALSINSNGKLGRELKTKNPSTKSKKIKI